MSGSPVALPECRPEQIAMRRERVHEAADVGGDEHDCRVQSSSRSMAAGRAARLPYSDRSNTAGITSATTARNSIAAMLVAAVRLNFCDRRPIPPTKNEKPRTSSRLPMMLPVIDALTSSTWPSPSATTAMISSAALPNVALRKPPHAGPERSASSSVAEPMSPASGTSETAAVMNTHGDVGASRCRPTRPARRRAAGSGGCETEAARRASLSRRTSSRSSSSAPGRRSKNASRLRSSARRSCGMVPSNVCSVTPAVEPSASRDRRLVDALQRAFGNQSDAVDEGVARHIADFRRVSMPRRRHASDATLMRAAGQDLRSDSRRSCARDRLVQRRHRAVELLLVHRLQDLAHRAGRARRPARADAGRARMARAADVDAERRARSRNQSIAVQLKSPGSRPRQSDLASRASSSRSTFCASRRNAPSPTSSRTLNHMPGFRCCATMPSTCAPHVVAVDRMDVEPIEKRGGRRDALLLVIDRPDPSVDERRRRRLAEVVADGAEHDREPAAGAARSSMRVRA